MAEQRIRTSLPVRCAVTVGAVLASAGFATGRTEAGFAVVAAGLVVWALRDEIRAAGHHDDGGGIEHVCQDGPADRLPADRRVSAGGCACDVVRHRPDRPGKGDRMSRPEKWEYEIVRLGRHRWGWRAWHWPASWPYGHDGGETYPAVDWRKGGTERTYARSEKKAQRAITSERERRSWEDSAVVREFTEEPA